MPDSTSIRIVAVIAASLLAGCITTTPATSVHQPLSTRPVQPAAAPVTNGAIYQVSYGYKPLFEDRRARNIGVPVDRVVLPDGPGELEDLALLDEQVEGRDLVRQVERHRPTSSCDSRVRHRAASRSAVSSLEAVR